RASVKRRRRLRLARSRRDSRLSHCRKHKSQVSHAKLFPPRERLSVLFAHVQVSGDPQPRSREYGGGAVCLSLISKRRRTKYESQNERESWRHFQPQPDSLSRSEGQNESEGR